MYNSVEGKRRGSINLLRGSYGGYRGFNPNPLPIIASNTHQMVVKFSSHKCYSVCYVISKKGFEAMFSAIEVDQK